MNRFFLPAGAAAILVAGETLSTDYARERSLRIEAETAVEMQTTSFSMERDGEPVDMPGGMGGRTSVEKQRSIEIDTVLERAGDRPTRVRRAFEELAAELSMQIGDGPRDDEHNCPLSGVTIEIAVDEGGETTAEVVDGEEPADEHLLERHRTALGLDGLLPTQAVEVGDAWDLEPEAIARALDLDRSPSLFPPPAREEADGGDRGDGRGRWRGRPGGGGSAARLLAGADWEGEATLVSLDDEHGGRACAVIDVKLEAAGDLPEPEYGEGGFGRGRMPGAGAASAALAASEYEISIEGRLYVSLEERRPLAAEFEGTIATEQHMERSRDESPMTMTITREGTYERTVTVTSVASEEPEEVK